MKKIILFFIFIWTIIIFSSFTNGSITDGLVAYYNDTSNGNDSVGNFNPDNIVGSPTIIGGILDNGFFFDGNDEIEYPDFDTYVSDGFYTLSFWLNYSVEVNPDFMINTRSQAGGTGIMTWQTGADLRIAVNDRTLTLADFGDGLWHFFVISVNNTNIKVYSDNSTMQKGTYTGANSHNDFYMGDRQGGGAVYTGNLDEIGVWNRTLTAKEVSGLYYMYLTDECNPVNNATCASEGIPPVVTNATNTSLLSAEFQQSDITFSSTNYFNAFSLEFNNTQSRNITFLTAFNIQKLNVPSESMVMGKIFVDGNEQIEESLSSVTGVNNIVSTGFSPFVFEVSAGNHNITVQFKRSGSGNIFINNFDLMFLGFITNESINVRHQFTSAEYSHSDTNFIRAFNWTINNAGNNTFVLGKLSITATEQAIPYYSFEHTDHGHNGIFSGRSLSDSLDIGTLFNSFLHNGTTQNWSILSLTNAGTVTVNGSILDFDLQDSNGNIINFFSITNSSSNISNNYTLTQERTKIINQTYIMKEGNGLFVGAIATIRSSSGEQSINMILNSTNTTIDCNILKQRTLIDNDDLGNIYSLGFCGGNLTKGSKIDMNLFIELDTGEQLQVIDELIYGFEITEIDISSIVFPSAIGLFMNATNNSIRVKNSYIPFNYSFNLGIGNTQDLVNCSFLIDGIINDTQINRTENNNYLFNYSVGTQEKDLEFSIKCENSEISNTTQNFLYKIDTEIPRLETSFINLSNYEKDDIIRFNGNCTDNNILAVNVSWFNILDEELQNLFVTNLTGNNYSFETSRIGTIEGINFYNRFICWDDHNPLPIKKKVNPLEWYFDNNNLIADNDFTFIGNFKEEQTYFYLSENKYKMKFTFNENLINHNIKFKSVNDLIFRGQNKYKGHFVYLPTNRFIDFEGDNIDYIIINKIENNEYDLDIHLFESSDEIEIESIGDLNVNSAIYFYDVIDTSGIQNFTGMEESITKVANSVTNFGWIIFFIFLIIVFMLMQLLHIQNKNLTILFIILFVALQVKFINIGESTFGWVCFLGWILSLIDVINMDEE